jgi:hypothetical protein
MTIIRGKYNYYYIRARFFPQRIGAHQLTSISPEHRLKRNEKIREMLANQFIPSLSDLINTCICNPILFKTFQGICSGLVSVPSRHAAVLVIQQLPTI